jgi:hypothetical protein
VLLRTSLDSNWILNYVISESSTQEKDHIGIGAGWNFSRYYSHDLLALKSEKMKLYRKHVDISPSKINQTTVGLEASPVHDTSHPKSHFDHLSLILKCKKKLRKSLLLLLPTN